MRCRRLSRERLVRPEMARAARLRPMARVATPLTCILIGAVDGLATRITPSNMRPEYRLPATRGKALVPAA
jgi:hypothetical protein